MRKKIQRVMRSKAMSLQCALAVGSADGILGCAGQRTGENTLPFFPVLVGRWVQVWDPIATGRVQLWAEPTHTNPIL